MHAIDVDGLRLHARVEGGGPPVVLLHGFTGSASTWDSLVEAVAPEFTAIAVDIVGHGASDAPTALERYHMARVVADLAALTRALGHERACWLGYSMGGRTALQVAVHQPAAVSALVLEGASPGLRSAAAREQRVRSDDALAARIEHHGVEAFVDEWERVPLFATQEALPAEVRANVRAGRLANSAAGLTNSLRGMGTGAQPPLHDHLGEVRVPALLLAGSLDTKYVEVASEMARSLPDATMQVVDNAGHAAHIEQPDAFNALVLDFLRRVYVGARPPGSKSSGQWRQGGLA